MDSILILVVGLCRCRTRFIDSDIVKLVHFAGHSDTANSRQLPNDGNSDFIFGQTPMVVRAASISWIKHLCLRSLKNRARRCSSTTLRTTLAIEYPNVKIGSSKHWKMWKMNALTGISLDIKMNFSATVFSLFIEGRDFKVIYFRCRFKWDIA